MDRSRLADFLRRRRAALVPDWPSARRVVGLRREEVAERAFISTDYYTRLEQRRGPRPSEQVTTALASALQLTADERDHLFALIGHNPTDPHHRHQWRWSSSAAPGVCHNPELTGTTTQGRWTNWSTDWPEDGRAM
ncbi:helix-turn-helix domain-containing protein [Streptomyces sp. CY1]|uniref:helix-turn-helix domain-containing protein n=1 Tax=Streptomyces sp. CY1 TaxID=3388313 RepID=UPI0039A0B0A5